LVVSGIEIYGINPRNGMYPDIFYIGNPIKGFVDQVEMLIIRLQGEDFVL
jgi:hypothetical protein